MKDITIGIDIGGTNTAFGFVEKNGNCIEQGKMLTNQSSEAELFVKELYLKINEVKNSIAEDINIKGIGIGVPNGNYYNGTIENAPNLKWEGTINLVNIFKNYFNLPVVLTNDANAAAMGEMYFGGAKGMKNFIVITIGTGLGSGIVVDGKVVYGHDGFAGEIGHTIIRVNGRKCGCGRRGCLEAYVSASGIKRTLLNLLADADQKSILDGVTIKNLSAKMIDEAALKGDEVALEAFSYTGKILGEALANAVAYTNPEAIFLFGGLAQADDLILKPTKINLEKNVLNVYKNKVKVLLSALNEDDAAILGASALAWEELIK